MKDVVYYLLQMSVIPVKTSCGISCVQERMPAMRRGPHTSSGKKPREARLKENFFSWGVPEQVLACMHQKVKLSTKHVAVAPSVNELVDLDVVLVAEERRSSECVEAPESPCVGTVVVVQAIVEACVVETTMDG